MFPSYEMFCSILLLATAINALEDAPVSHTACSQKVCVFNVISKTLAVTPCTHSSILVAYSESTGATLIQCTSAASEEDNRTFIYNRYDSEAQSFVIKGNRFIETSYLPEALKSELPKRSGTMSLCSVKEKGGSEHSGVLHIAEREPSESESNPYCYRIRSVLVESEALVVRDDRGHTIAHTAKAVAANWNPIREKLSPYIASKASLDESPGPSVIVKSPRARLFTEPNLDAVSKMYLVQGDKVIMLGDLNKNVLCHVRYINRDGRSIDRWIQRQDLDIQINDQPKR